jgi:hypothetical protein
MSRKLRTCRCHLNREAETDRSWLKTSALTCAISIQVARPDEESFEVTLQPRTVQGYTFVLQLYPVMDSHMGPQLLQKANPSTESRPVQVGVNESVAWHAEDLSISECGPICIT